MSSFAQLMPSKKSNRWLLLLTVVAAVVLGYYIIASHASSMIAVGADKPGVPVPNNLYFGGSASMQFFGGTANPPAGCNQGGYEEVECGITWAAAQQSLSAPYAAGSDGYVHTSLYHDYVANCDNDLNSVKAGGSVYKEASEPGRKVIIINFKCGDYSVLAGSGGTAAVDTTVKNYVDAIDKLPVPVIFAYHHEPENDGCSATMNPDEYRAASRQFAADVRAEESKNKINNISIGFILMGETYNMSAGTTGDNGKSTDYVYSGCSNLHYFNGGSDPSKSYEYRNVENWWPGDDDVDWVGSDVYNGSDYDNLVSEFVSWGACPAKAPSSNYTCTSARKTKPLMVSEFGVQSGTPASIATWIGTMHSQALSAANSRIKALAYFMIIQPATDTAHVELKAYAKLAYDKAFAIPTFSKSTPSPTATPTASPSPTNTPTPTASVTPTPTATAKPTPTPTSSPKPTNTPGPGLVGDFNKDGHVNIQDLSVLLAHWGSKYPYYDLNGDGVVNAVDLSILASHWTG